MFTIFVPRSSLGFFFSLDSSKIYRQLQFEVESENKNWSETIIGGMSMPCSQHGCKWNWIGAFLLQQMRLAMTDQTQTKLEHRVLSSLKVISLGLCVRTPRPFALITGWMAGPLLAWCFFLLLKWPLAAAAAVRWIAQCDAPYNVTRAGNFHSCCKCLATYFIQWSPFVCCFYGRSGAHFADEKPRRFLRFAGPVLLPISTL